MSRPASAGWRIVYFLRRANHDRLVARSRLRQPLDLRLRKHFLRILQLAGAATIIKLDGTVT